MTGGIFERVDADLIEPQRLAGAVVDRVLINRRQRDYTGRALTAREALNLFSSVGPEESAENVDLTRV